MPVEALAKTGPSLALLPHKPMKHLRGAGEYLTLALIWIGLIILFGLLSKNFFSPDTWIILAGQIPALTVVAVGMTLHLVSMRMH